ncbi:MAG: hypothetical protein ACREEM_55020 [Blastocatellia bacterium]
MIGEIANGIRVVGASSPSGVVAGRRHVFVSNANNDSVSILRIPTDKQLATETEQVMAKLSIINPTSPSPAARRSP